MAKIYRPDAFPAGVKLVIPVYEERRSVAPSNIFQGVQSADLVIKPGLFSGL